jgi:hypothetical protein
MGEAGSPYARFRRSLDTRNMLIIRAAAAELPFISLEDALKICVVLRDQEPARFDAAAIRWIGRYCTEREGVTLDDVDDACAAFEQMRTDPAGALEQLQAVCAAHTRP